MLFFVHANCKNLLFGEHLLLDYVHAPATQNVLHLKLYCSSFT